MKCLHMSGAGNDFMVIDARETETELDFAKMAVELCAKTGADGFMAVGKSDIADFRLHFYNSDGSRGEMCGNGARCICKFAYDHAIAGAEMTVQTDAGLVPGWRIEENLYRIHLNNPSTLDFYRRQDAVYVELGNPGIPHSVTELPALHWKLIITRYLVTILRCPSPSLIKFLIDLFASRRLLTVRDTSLKN